MDPEHSKQVIQALIGAYKGLRLYPLQHPEIQRQMERLVHNIFSMLHSLSTIRIGLLEGTLFLETHLFVDHFPAAVELAELLESFEIEGLEFNRGLSAEELEGLLQVFKEHRARGDQFDQALQARGIRHICSVQVKEDDDDDEASPRKIYRRALKVVDRIFHDVRLGTIPASEQAIGTIKSMAHMTLTEPHALFAMSMLKDYDNYTFNHSVNVAVIALTVGRACNLDEERLRILGLGALLHDIGKLEVDWDIINKPGQLTDAEFEEIKRHPKSGADIVRKMHGITPDVIDIVLSHHVHFNRDGYPTDARSRTKSPLVDMAAIADTYDAMTTLRAYQRPIPPSKAAKRLRELAGSTLNPEMVERFIAFLGPWPVGTLVRLDTNQIALVTWVGTEHKTALRLKILLDADGNLLKDLPEIELTGTGVDKVVAEVDPFVKGINVTDYLD
ncbi:MAG TPA: HD domain-containing phosphohydrolase [Geothermobacteraceae bacterium]|nr:HD domain-containing phosphohydrolase [Geothermobacteraceae bacterium]